MPISVIMPVYNQAHFIKGAIYSLLSQTYPDWELIIVDDGSTDGTSLIIDGLTEIDGRIRGVKNIRNKGLGYSLNLGISNAKYEYLAYLPADDIYFSDHLTVLYQTLVADESAVVCFSGIKYSYSDNGLGSISNFTYSRVNNKHLQLVQVLHKKVEVRWLEREELTTDNLDLMYFNELHHFGGMVNTMRVTAEWVSHANQRHKLINEFFGGNIYIYKKYYGVKSPIRFQSSFGTSIDEFSDFEKGNERASKQAGSHKLKILIVGELAYNADRIRAFEDKGHELYGLWIDRPFFYNTVGPLPFGNVEDVDADNWKARVDEIKPDIIYALLNFPAVPFAHEVMMATKHIPFVWHFKEGPFYCRQRGTWDSLIELYENSDGQVYINQQTKQWFEQFLLSANNDPFILDGDLPYGLYFKDERSDPISKDDGQIHTVIPGRPFGLLPKDVSKMADQNIHLHFYGNHDVKYRKWIDSIEDYAKPFLHLHPNCLPSQWTKELSQYDAGWLHVFDSKNFGEIARFEWADINYPARMSTLAAAGLPMIQKNNAMHMVATQDLTKQLGIGIFFSTYEELADKLRNKNELNILRTNCWNHRHFFSFDYHVDHLCAYFQKVIENFTARI